MGMNQKPTIFFDLGNVLVHVDKRMAIRKLSEITGRNTIEIADLISSEKEEAFERGEMTSLEYLSYFREKFQLPESLTLEELTRWWIVPFTPNEPVLNMLPKLRRQTKIFLLSNTNAIHIGALENAYRILPRLDGAILSYEVGFLKPDRKIYEIALERAGVRANKSIFIDDLKENVEGAKSIGMRAHQYLSTADLTAFLESEGFDLSSNGNPADR
jgi:putative hydrolase of the HAD superfamily